MVRYPPNVSQITATENVTNDNNSGGNNNISIITYDHLGNPLRLGQSVIKYLIMKLSVAWKHYSCILQSDVFHINIVLRRFIEKMSRKQQKIHWDACSLYRDNHADTICFGRKIRPISFTSEEFTVAPFLEKYS